MRLSIAIMLLTLLISCKENDSFTSFDREMNSKLYNEVGDTAYAYAEIHIEDNVNGCSEGFDNYTFIRDGLSVPLCIFNNDKRCLPDYMNKNGFRVRIVYVVLPIPPNARLRCAPIELLSIRAADHIR